MTVFHGISARKLKFSSKNFQAQVTERFPCAFFSLLLTRDEVVKFFWGKRKQETFHKSSTWEVQKIVNWHFSFDSTHQTTVNFKFMFENFIFSLHSHFSRSHIFKNSQKSAQKVEKTYQSCSFVVFQLKIVNLIIIFLLLTAVCGNATHFPAIFYSLFHF